MKKRKFQEKVVIGELACAQVKGRPLPVGGKTLMPTNTLRKRVISRGSSVDGSLLLKFLLFPNSLEPCALDMCFEILNHFRIGATQTFIS